MSGWLESPADRPDSRWPTTNRSRLKHPSTRLLDTYVLVLSQEIDRSGSVRHAQCAHHVRDHIAALGSALDEDLIDEVLPTRKGPVRFERLGELLSALMPNVLTPVGSS